METATTAVAAAWWPSALLAAVSGLIVLLFVVTLLLHHVPVLQKWLLPVLARIAPAKVHEQQEQRDALGRPQALHQSGEQRHQRSSHFLFNTNDHSYAVQQEQQHQQPYQRSVLF